MDIYSAHPFNATFAVMPVTQNPLWTHAKPGSAKNKKPSEFMDGSIVAELDRKRFFAQLQ